MYEFISQLPNSPIGWIGLIIAAIAGGAGAYMVYNKQKDGADDRLINILKGTVDALEEKVNKQSEDIKALTEKVDDLERENETLVEVLQGRDKSTLEFQRQMLEAMRIGMETNGLAKETSNSLNRLTDLISAHIVAIETQDNKRKSSI